MATVKELIQDFNSIFSDFILKLGAIVPNTIIGQNAKTIKSTINNMKPENKAKFIDIFVAKILQYKDKIDAGDESFFLNRDYSGDMDGDNTILNHVLNFKKLWTKLTDTNKQMVIMHMQILCDIAAIYFELRDKEGYWA